LGRVRTLRETNGHVLLVSDLIKKNTLHQSLYIGAAYLVAFRSEPTLGSK
jgi:hypothetical protein